MRWRLQLACPPGCDPGATRTGANMVWLAASCTPIPAAPLPPLPLLPAHLPRCRSASFPPPSPGIGRMGRPPRAARVMARGGRQGSTPPRRRDVPTTHATAADMDLHFLSPCGPPAKKAGTTMCGCISAILMCQPDGRCVLSSPMQQLNIEMLQS